MAVFWDVMPYSLVDFHLYFEGTSENIYQTSWRHTPGDSSLHSRRRDNLGSNKI
jgi:hypothetical protein